MFPPTDNEVAAGVSHLPSKTTTYAHESLVWARSKVRQTATLLVAKPDTACWSLFEAPPIRRRGHKHLSQERDKRRQTGLRLREHPSGEMFPKWGRCFLHKPHKTGDQQSQPCVREH